MLYLGKRRDHMEIRDPRIDGGKAFDWGRTSADYARYRDIYPPVFYQKIADKGYCRQGSRVLDLGTGTGVLPRNMYHYGAQWVGTDISEEQIIQAKALASAQQMDIQFQVGAAETLGFPDGSFDTVTACQCFWYFDHEKVLPALARMLKPRGTLIVLQMAWLPYEDKIAGQSEALALEFNPGWTGAGETRKPVWIPEIAYAHFSLTDHEEYDLPVHFTRESWHGRMRACRGIGASLTPEELERWELAHRAMLERIAPEEFDILHYAAYAILQKRA